MYNNNNIIWYIYDQLYTTSYLIVIQGCVDKMTWVASYSIERNKKLIIRYSIKSTRKIFNNKKRK